MECLLGGCGILSNLYFCIVEILNYLENRLVDKYCERMKGSFFTPPITRCMYTLMINMERNR